MGLPRLADGRFSRSRRAGCSYTKRMPPSGLEEEVGGASLPEEEQHALVGVRAWACRRGEQLKEGC